MVGPWEAVKIIELLREYLAKYLREVNKRLRDPEVPEEKKVTWLRLALIDYNALLHALEEWERLERLGYGHLMDSKPMEAIFETYYNGMLNLLYNTGHDIENMFLARREVIDTGKEGYRPLREHTFTRAFIRHAENTQRLVTPTADWEARITPEAKKELDRKANEVIKEGYGWLMEDIVAKLYGLRSGTYVYESDVVPEEIKKRLKEDPVGFYYSFIEQKEKELQELESLREQYRRLTGLDVEEVLSEEEKKEYQKNPVEVLKRKIKEAVEARKRPEEKPGAAPEIREEIKKAIDEVLREYGWIRPETARKLREVLPGKAIEAILDEWKLPLFMDHRGVHWSYINYLLHRTSPDDPLGTALLPLYSHVFSRWEKEIDRGEKPTHPYDIIKEIYDRFSGLHSRYRQLVEQLDRSTTKEERKRILQELDNVKREMRRVLGEAGIPTHITPEVAKKSLEELLRDLKDLKEGRVDPHSLDAEHEAALRYHSLKHYARGEPGYGEEIAEALRETLNDIIGRIMVDTGRAVQAGREETRSLLDRVRETAEEYLPRLEQAVREGRPIHPIVAEATKKLEERIGDGVAKGWAANLLRKLLTDLPLLAAAKTMAYHPMEENMRAAAHLLKLYEEAGRRHSITPMTAGLHAMHEKVSEAGTREEALERIGVFRGFADNAVAVAGTLRDGLKALMAEPFSVIVREVNGRREMLVDASVVRLELREARKRVLEATYYVHC